MQSRYSVGMCCQVLPVLYITQQYGNYAYSVYIEAWSEVQNFLAEKILMLK